MARYLGQWTGPWEGKQQMWVHMLCSGQLQARKAVSYIERVWLQCFDASKASAALLALLDNGLDVRGKRSLVPGCGVSNHNTKL